MKAITTILLLFLCVSLSAQMIVPVAAKRGKIGGNPPAAVYDTVAKFNFALSSTSQSGWVNVYGTPLTGVVSVSDNRSGTNHTVSTRNTSYWSNISSSSTSNNSGGATVANPTFVVPANVLLGWFGNGRTNYVDNDGTECFEFSGLDNTKEYDLYMYGSRTTGQSSRKCVYIVIDNEGIKRDTLDVKDNTANFAEIINIKPFSDGTFRMHMKRDPSDANNTWGAYLNAATIIRHD